MLLASSGWPWLRTAERQSLGMSLQEPPRSSLLSSSLDELFSIVFFAV